MSRRRDGRRVDGVLFLDKPTQMSSNHALVKVRTLYQAQKAGHGGTLDPFASGILPILLGEATKFSRFFLSGDKTYQVVLKLGCETDTDDVTGVITRRAAVIDPCTIDWTQCFEQFTGTIWQQPPVYSAIKVNGKRAYAMARAGEIPVLAPRSVTIHEIILKALNGNEITLEVRCSGGTYIRALARDIGRYLNSAAHVIALRRLAVGSYRSPFYPLDILQDKQKGNDFSALDACLLPIHVCIAHLPRWDISEEAWKKLRYGNPVQAFIADGRYALFWSDQFIGIGVAQMETLCVERLCRQD